MMNYRIAAWVMLAMVLSGTSSRLLAHEGHEKTKAPAAVASPAAANPDGAARATSSPATEPQPSHRFTATGSEFELVGVLQGRKLTLWLDHAATNTPVTAAALEMDLGDIRLKPVLDGQVWTALLPSDPVPGTLAVTATVTAAGQSDLLTAELLLPVANPVMAPAAPAALWPWGLGGLLALASLGAGIAWLMRRPRA